MRTLEAQVTWPLVAVVPANAEGPTVPLKVPVACSETRPPIVRPQMPPDVSSGVALGSPATKAFPWARNEVLIVPITELMALAAPRAPPRIWVCGPATTLVGSRELVQPG